MTLDKKISISRALSLGSYGLIIILMVASTFLSEAPEEASRGLMLAVKLVPLLIVLPGIIKDSLRAHIWLCFIILFYFTQSVVSAYLSKGEPIAVLTCISTVVLFLASMMYVRWQRNTGRALN